MRSPVATAAHLAAVVLIVGCASTDPPAPTASPAPPASPAPAVLERAARADSVREHYTAADVAFMTGMIHHHAQALVMSRMAPSHGASDPLRTLAARIINSQNDEIHLMQRWLRERGEPVPSVADDGTIRMPMPADSGDSPATPDASEAAGHEDAGHEADEHAGHEADGHGRHAAGMERMAGMLTPAQLEELESARGEAWDRLFLKYMIQHHQGAVVMVDELFASPGAGQGDAIFKIASDIAADQASEIDRMQRMLHERVFGTTP